MTDDGSYWYIYIDDVSENTLKGFEYRWHLDRIEREIEDARHHVSGLESELDRLIATEPSCWDDSGGVDRVMIPDTIGILEAIVEVN